MTWLPWQPDQYHLLTVHLKDLSMTIKMILTLLKSDCGLTFCAYFSENTFFRQKCPGISRVPPPERLAHLGLKVAPSLNLDTTASLNITEESSFRNCIHIKHVHCKHQFFTSSFEGGNNQHFAIAHIQNLFNKN